MLRMFDNFKGRVRNTARAAALSIIGAVFCLAGLAFLTIALWIIIATHYGATIAFTTIGLIYLLAGFCLIALSWRAGNSTSHHRSDTNQASDLSDPPREPFVQLAEGFAIGLNAGRAARSQNR